MKTAGSASPRSCSSARSASRSTRSATSATASRHAACSSGIRIQGVDADLLLITHERFDHNGAGAILDPPDAFLAACDGEVRRIDGPEAELEGLLGNGVSQVIGLLTPPA